MKILLDTNFLLIPAQFKVDIFSEMERICDFPYKLYILRDTIDELNNIMQNQKGKDKWAAKLALQLIKQQGLNIIDFSDGEYVDEKLLNLADEYIIATQDIKLKKLLKERGARLIVLRGKKRLQKCFTRH